jgi:hypothetical protein
MKAVKEEATNQQTAAQVSVTFIKEVWSLLKTIWLYLVSLNRRWNEAWLIVIAILMWKYADVAMGYIDPTAPPLPVNDLMRFLYATIGTCIAHFVVNVMLWLSHPLVHRYLYGLFYNDLYEKTDTNSLKYDLRCIRLKYSLLVWLFYLATWLLLAATY